MERREPKRVSQGCFLESGPNLREVIEDCHALHLFHAPVQAAQWRAWPQAAECFKQEFNLLASGRKHQDLGLQEIGIIASINGTVDAILQVIDKKQGGDCTMLSSLQVRAMERIDCSYLLHYSTLSSLGKQLLSRQRWRRPSDVNV